MGCRDLYRIPLGQFRACIHRLNFGNDAQTESRFLESRLKAAKDNCRLHFSTQLLDFNSVVGWVRYDLLRLSAKGVIDGKEESINYSKPDSKFKHN